MRKKKIRKEQQRAAYTDTSVVPGYQLFLEGGSEAFGAVRAVGGDRGDWTINIENGGDFLLPVAAIQRVSNQKVIVGWDALPAEIQEAIKHALDLEDFPPVTEDPEARAMDEQDDLDARPPSPSRGDTPPGEFPGRDVGSRYGAPPSITSPRKT